MVAGENSVLRRQIGPVELAEAAVPDHVQTLEPEDERLDSLDCLIDIGREAELGQRLEGADVDRAPVGWPTMAVASPTCPVRRSRSPKPCMKTRSGNSRQRDE